MFGDKDGLIDAVAEHVMATYVAAKTGAVADAADPVEDLRSAWRMHVDFGLANAELYTLLSSRGHGVSSPATAAGIDVLRARVRRLATAGLLRVDEQRAVMMIHAAGTGAIFALLGAPASDRDLALSDAMLEAVMHAILAKAPAAPDSRLSTVAVTFLSMVSDLPALTDAERALMAEWLTRSIAHLH
jgi:AcrR family transcriptional regulator